MSAMPRSVTMRGKPLTLTGKPVKVGDLAPDFTGIDANLDVFRFHDHQGKVFVLSAVPSIDTSVCDKETRRFNELAADLDPNVEIITLSMDLPFALKRWCGATGVDRVRLLSDHREASFGQNYGVLIEELRLLARAVFVVDREGKISYIEVVPEIAQEPDYDKVLEAVKAAL
ncbi:MAG: thiol peroxidase [Calditrichaeota bacterium]|nr:MAG: thiol peroxidase [Calditrichota bacterium]